MTEADLTQDCLLHICYVPQHYNGLIKKPSMGALPDADRAAEMTEACGDIMKVIFGN